MTRTRISTAWVYPGCSVAGLGFHRLGFIPFPRRVSADSYRLFRSPCHALLQRQNKTVEPTGLSSRWFLRSSSGRSPLTFAQMKTYLSLTLALIGSLVSISCKSNGYSSTSNKDKTSALLRSTVIEIVDWPEQPLVDRLHLIRQEAATVGISVDVSQGISGNPTGSIRPAMRFRNMPLIESIRFTVDSTTLRIRIEDSGVLYFYLANEEIAPPPREANDPFEPQSEQDAALDPQH